MPLKRALARIMASAFDDESWRGSGYSSRPSVCLIREFTNVRRRRQDDGYQYNDLNPIAQNKLIFKSIAGFLDVVQALLKTEQCIFSRLL
jgi:hypothetical protein